MLRNSLEAKMPIDKGHQAMNKQSGCGHMGQLINGSQMWQHHKTCEAEALASCYDGEFSVPARPGSGSQLFDQTLVQNLL